VDQQPAPGKRNRSSSKAEESVNESPTPEPSPATGTTSWEQPEAYHSSHIQPTTVASESAGHFPFASPMLDNDDSGMSNLSLNGVDADSMLAVSNTSYNSLNMYSQPPWSSTPILNSPFHSTETSQFDASHPTQWHPRAQSGLSGHEIPSYASSAMQTPLHSTTQEHFPHFPATHDGEVNGLSHYSYHPSRSMSLANPNDLQNYHSPYHNDAQMFPPRHPTTSSELQMPSLLSNTNPTPPGSDTHSTPNTYSYGDHPQMNPYQSGTPMHSPPMAGPVSEAFGGQWYTPPSGLPDVKEEEEMAGMHPHYSMSGRFRQNAG
jgi:hypothetical protein